MGKEQAKRLIMRRSILECDLITKTGVWHYTESISFMLLKYLIQMTKKKIVWLAWHAVPRCHLLLEQVPGARFIIKK